MDDVSLVPVEHQPDFENVSLVPVDHDPFSDGGTTQRAPGQRIQSQPAQTRSGQSMQPQPTDFQPQSQSQPVPPARPNPAISGVSVIGGDSGSPFVRYFNQVAAPELAQSESVADLVRNNPTAAKIEGTIGLGSLLFPPLAIAGAEGLGLFGVGAAADGLAGATISGAGRVVAGSAARQAIAEAEATLPEGIKRAQFGRLAGFERGLEASRAASTEATAEIMSRLKSAGVTTRSIAASKKSMRVLRVTIHPTCRQSTAQLCWRTS